MLITKNIASNIFWKFDNNLMQMVSNEIIFYFILEKIIILSLIFLRIVFIFNKKSLMNTFIIFSLKKEMISLYFYKFLDFVTYF